SGRLRLRGFSGNPKTLCFLCRLLFKFSSLLGFAEAKREASPAGIFRKPKNPLFPLLPSVQILLSVRVCRSKARGFACEDFPETQKPFVSFAAFCSNSPLS